MNPDILWQLIKPQDVWFVMFPHEEDPSVADYHPAIVIDKDSDSVKVLSVMITSSEPRHEGDFLLHDWAEIPLYHLSTVLPHRLALLPLKNFKHRVGSLPDKDWQHLLTELEKLSKPN